MKFLAIAILILAVLITVFWPILFGGQVFADPDPLVQTYPLFLQAEELIRNNLWMPQLLAGYTNPVWFVNFKYNFIYFLLAKILAPLEAYHWMLLFYFFLAALCLYIFSRSLQLSSAACLVATFTFILSEFCIYRGRLDTNCRYFFFLPLFFYVLHKISQGKNYLILPMGIFTGLAWWMLDARLLLYIFLAVFFYAFYLDLQQYNHQLGFLKNWLTLKKFSLITLISAIIGWPILWTGLRFAQATAFGGELKYRATLTNGFGPLDFLRFLSPYFRLESFSALPALFYIGILPLIFVLVAIFYLKGKPTKSFFTFLFLFFLIISLKYSPLFYFFSRLPIFSYFKNQTRFLFLVIFALAILAGYGFEYLVSQPRKIDRLANWLKYIVGLITGLALISNLLFWLIGQKMINWLQQGFDKYFYQESMAWPKEHYGQIIEQQILGAFANISFFQAKFLIALSFILISYWLIKIYQEEKISLAGFKYLGLTIVLANFLLIYQGYHPLISQSLYLKTPSTVKFIQNREADNYSFRIFSFVLSSDEYEKIFLSWGGQPANIFAFKSAVIQPNLNLIAHLQSIDGYDNFMPRRQAKLLAELGSDQAPIGQQIIDLDRPSEQIIKIFLSRLNILSMLNVKYIISPHQLDQPDLKLVFIDQITDKQIPIYLYQNLKVMPRIYWAQQIKFIESDEDKNLEMILDPTIDFSQFSFIECLDCQKGLPTEESIIEIEEYRADYLKLKTETKKENWLIFSQSFYPGWRAKIDGQPTTIYRANYIFQAILVPAGQHLIEFKYQSPIRIPELF